ncbi:MAG TPA: hypothetical protein VFA88_11165 [Gaiellaceae bacterium]|nr:hypothetical protein [Gaiellaceae bacterium]
MRRDGASLAAYLGVSLVYFGVPIASRPGRYLIGAGPDPSVLVWALAWWPHAALHWQNPIVTHAIWAPVGQNLAWAPSVPGLALLAAPVTLLAGPAVAYNLLAIVLPALAAWTAYLLCRYLTHAFWPSLVGGYLFGFSAYELGQTEGHMQVTAVFLVPLVALVVLRFLDCSSGRRTALTLGVLLAFQLSFSAEVALTLTLTLAVALVVAFAVFPAARARLRALLAPLAGAYAIGGLLASPLLVYFFLQFNSSGVNSPDAFPADLANLVIPTHLTWVSWRWTDSIAARFLGNESENGAYLGLPCIAIVGWFLWTKRRAPAARLLGILLAFGLVVELGFSVHVAGRSYFPLPWSKVGNLPAVNSMLPVRYALFVALGAGVAVALWAAGDAPWLARVTLPALAVVAILPSVWNPAWHEHPPRPRFFTAGTYRTCLTPGENVLVLPFPRWSGAMLWQAESDFYFRLADGYISTVPTDLPDYDYADQLANTNRARPDWRPLVKLARDQEVTMILLAGEAQARWRTLLAPVTTPAEIGGVTLFSLRPNGRSACTAGSPSA